VTARWEHVRALLGGPPYAKLFAAVRGRVESGGAQARSVTVSGLDGRERGALAGLLGLSALPAGEVSVDLGKLDAALRESAVGDGLVVVLEGLGGPLRDLRADRDAALAARERVWREAEVRVAARPGLGEWLGELRGSGAVRRAGRGAVREEELLARAVTVALRLPAGGILLPVLASSCTGDPHALDPGAPLGALVLRAAALIAGWTEVPTAAAARRRLWAEVGVDCDALSSQVLVLGLRAEGGGYLARQLREAAAAGEPRRVTLRELRQADLDIEGGSSVFVCENPAVVAAAADALGSRSAALVCVEGVPSTAAMELLRRLADRGGRLLVHADFDWAGLRIAGQVIAVPGSGPWRFGVGEYLSALNASGTGPAMIGRAAISPWDPALATAMNDRGVSVPEERVVAALLEDLEAAVRAACDPV